jgi:hypothetical protein
MMRPERSGSCRGPGVSPQLLIGLLVIAVGVLMTLDKLGFVRAADYVRFWPAGLIAIGGLKVFYARHGGPGAAGGILFAAVGAWLLLDDLALVHLDLRDVWPALLVIGGGYLVWQAMARPGPGAVADDTRALVSAVAVLSGVTRGSNSPAFRGGDLTAVMGGCEIDLRQAAIDGEAVIEVFALWGGIEIRVPDDWTVESRIVALLGGVDDKTRPPHGAGRHHLVLRGLVVMAGLEVKN